MSGRPRKPTAELQLQGTYRDDRHKNRPENNLGSYLQVPEKVTPPDTLKTKYCRDYYSYHVNLLISFGVLTISDLPEIQMIFETLEQYREVFTQLKSMDPLKDLDNYDKMTRLLLKLGMRFSDLGAKYCISPTARNKMTLDVLNIQKSETENASVINKLIGKKKV